MYRCVWACDPAGYEDKKKMKIKALLIGPGSGIVLYAVLYAINGWRAVGAGFAISLLIMAVVLWSER